MPSCIIKSCSFSWRTRTEELILHAFPRNRDRIRKWLEQLDVPEGDLEYFLERIATSGKGIYRICSRHFKDTDYEMRGPHKVLKSTAYPTLNLASILERAVTSYTNNRANMEHDYYKRVKTEQAHTSRDSPTQPSEISSDNAFSFIETSPTSDDVFQFSVPEDTECDLEETQYVDCILDKSSASGSLSTEPSSEIPISHTQISKGKHCKICSHGLLVSKKAKVNKTHRSTQCNKENDVCNKRFQFGVKKSKVSIGTQCSLVDLPPLSLLPPAPEDSFHYSFVQGLSSEPAIKKKVIKQRKCRDENINILELSPVPRIEQDHFFSSCGYFSAFDNSVSPQKIRSDKDTPYRNEQFNLEQLEEEEVYVDSADPDLSFLYLPPSIGHSSMAKEKKFLVFEKCLDQLLMSSRCMSDTQCNGCIIGLRKYTVGSALVVYAECSLKHKFRLWTSQPFIGRIPVGNLLISAAVLCSGSNLLKMQTFFSLLEMPAISTTNHNNNQNNYLFPTIEHHWFSQRSEILEQVGQKGVALLGHIQCDSPGFGAKYCTSTLLEAESQCIIDFQVEQLQTDLSSVSIENLAFVQALNRILSDQVRVKVIATDRQVSMKKVIKERYPRIKHELDVWHIAKSVGAKLHTSSKKKNCRELSSWVHLAKDHLWWVSSSCQNNPILLKEKWLSIIYHSANVHEWTGNTLYHRCSHPPIPEDKEKEYEWLTPGSAAHHEFKSIVQDSQLLEDLDHLSIFFHRGAIKVFHNMALKYCSKQHRLLKDAMVARTQLAALDHNQNISRLQSLIRKPNSTSDPEVYSPKFSKTKKHWTVSKIDHPASNVFMKEIISDALDFAAGLRNFP